VHVEIIDSPLLAGEETAENDGPDCIVRSIRPLHWLDFDRPLPIYYFMNCRNLAVLQRVMYVSGYA